MHIIHPSRVLSLALAVTLLFFSVAPGLVARADDSDAQQNASTTSEAQVADSPSETPPASDPSVTEDASSTPDVTAPAVQPETQTDASSDNTASASSTPADSDALTETVSGTATSSTGFILPEDILASTSPATSTPPSATSTLSDSQTETPAESADNNATTTPPHSIITGAAMAFINILNLLNTTFVNSLGSILFSNILNSSGNIDLRTASLFSGACGTQTCDGQQGALINLLQDASIDNEIFVSADSGGNSANGTSTVQTGNAYAGLNLINLANTTFINSNYLLATLNAFTDVNGDIVFPSLINFENALSQSSTTAAVQGLSADGSVENDVTGAANSGNNALQGGSDSLIETGSSTAFTNVYNDVNSVSGSSLAILFRIAGAWNGNIYGLPDSVSFVRGADGSMFIFTPPQNTTSTSLLPTLNTLSGTTSADIVNHVGVSAGTGQNSVSDAGDSSLIATGNALAGANIVNVANQTVIGKNWILAIINIFGDLNGNISFGMPDLWVGDRVEGPAFVANGSHLNYTLTVSNKGDANATGVTLTETPSSFVEFSDSDHDAVQNSDGTVTWKLGTLAPGASVEVRYSGNVTIAAAGTALTDATSVSETEPDNNLADNSDSATISMGVAGGGGGGIVIPSSSYTGSSGGSGDVGLGQVSRASLSVTRSPTNSTTTTDAPSASQHLAIQNTSTIDAQDVVVTDTLFNPSGVAIHTEEWHIGTVHAKEEVDIEYDAAFGAHAPLGMYTLITRVTGTGMNPIIADNGTITLEAAPLPPYVHIPIPPTPKVPLITRHPLSQQNEVASTTPHGFVLGIEAGPPPPATGMPLATTVGILGAGTLFAALRFRNKIPLLRNSFLGHL